MLTPILKDQNESSLNNCIYLHCLFQTLICGLLGLPPCNGVLPQAPMHTKSLAVLRRQVSEHLERGKEGEKKEIVSSIFLLKFLHSLHEPQLIRKKMIAKAKECIDQDASNMEMYEKLQDAFLEMEPARDVGVFMYIYGLV